MNKLKYENIKAMLYALILLTAFVLPAAAQTISIASQSVGPGGTVTVPIMANGITNVAAFTISLTYIPAVVVVDSVGAGALGGVIANINNATGLTQMSAFSTTPQSGSVILASVTLRAVGTAGQTSSLTITVSEIVDNNGIPIPVTINSGTFSIPTIGSITTGNITGTVTNASSSAPIAGATVTAANATFGTTTEINVNGSYSISIAPGTYTVTASVTGYQSSNASVTVASGATTTQNFALTPVSTDLADTNHDHVVDINELMTAIGWWKAGTYDINSLMTSIRRLFNL